MSLSQVTSLTVDGEPARDYGAVARNQSRWAAAAPQQAQYPPPVIQELAATESFEQLPTYVWQAPPAPASQRASATTTLQSGVTAVALTINLGLTPSLASELPGVAQGPRLVQSIYANMGASGACTGCTLHLCCTETSNDTGTHTGAGTGTGTGTGPGGGGWLCSDAVKHTAGAWARHTFLSAALPKYSNHTVMFGVEVRYAAGRAPKEGVTLGYFAGYSLRRLGSTLLV